MRGRHRMIWDVEGSMSSVVDLGVGVVATPIGFRTASYNVVSTCCHTLTRRSILARHMISTDVVFLDSNPSEYFGCTYT